MTRLLVLGSSHAGALRAADAAFRRAFPAVETGYFTAPSGVFLSCRTDRQGRFALGPAARAHEKTILRINGTLSCDLKAWDHILLVGFRPTFDPIADLFVDCDLLEGVRTGRPRLVSQAFLAAIARQQAETFIAALRARFRGDRRLTIQLGPSPSEGALDDPDAGSLPKRVAARLAHPDLPAISDWWLTVMTRAIEATGRVLTDQPPETLAGPAVTRRDYAERAINESGVLHKRTDHIHMNADYGLAVLSGFATRRLGLAPSLHQRADQSQQEVHP